MLTILCVISLCFFMAHGGSVDLTKVPKAHGQMVIQTAIKDLENTCLFSNDLQFLRRAAWVSTQFGDKPLTFQNNRLMGVFSLDSISFAQTQNASAYNRGHWTAYVNKIQYFIGKPYTNLSYNHGDLLVPLYSALATRFYLEHVTETFNIKIPYSVQDQANFYARYYNAGRGAPNATFFINEVNKMPAVCNAAGADILFILDASGSIGSGNFQLMLKFVQNVVGQPSFPIGPNAYRFAVDRFSSDASSQITFNGYNNSLTTLQQQISNIRYTSGGTATSLALDHALSVSFNETSGQGARNSSKGYPKIAIVITDGEPNSITATNIAAQIVKQNGITLFVVGVGNAFTSPSDIAELNIIASPPKCQRVYLLDFGLLADFTAELQAQSCQTTAVLPGEGKVQNVVKMNQYFYFTFNANATLGISFQVSMNAGSVTLYLSRTVLNPNEVEYDYAINATVSNGGGIFIPPITLLGDGPDAEGVLMMEEVLLARAAVTNNNTNATIPVYGSLKGTSNKNNNFTLLISQGNTIPNTTTTVTSTSATQTKSIGTPSQSGMLQIFLEYFDNTAGGGRLYSTKNRCDPFWFTGIDQCDLAIQICVERIGKPNFLTACSTGWIDLGQVTSNANNATFPLQRIGGWNNPMAFQWNYPWQGFQIKYLVFDVDNGGRQIVDSNVCSYSANVGSTQGALSCSHTRPNGFPTSLRLSFLKQ